MITEKLKKIKLLLLDVDGILTDGSIIYTDNGTEIKTFSVKDGLGIKMMKKAGIQVGIVTGRSSDALLRRCRDLDIELIYDGISDKAAILDRIHEITGINAEHIAFMGDDLPDLPLMKRVGLSISVPNAAGDVIAQADVVTQRAGGAGAVREICEEILMAGGHWAKVIKQFA